MGWRPLHPTPAFATALRHLAEQGGHGCSSSLAPARKEAAAGRMCPTDVATAARPRRLAGRFAKCPPVWFAITRSVFYFFSKCPHVFSNRPLIRIAIANRDPIFFKVPPGICIYHLIWITIINRDPMFCKMDPGICR
jgi:hypothetical protein